MSVIYGHPVIAATRALRFSDHVTNKNGGSGDENDDHLVWYIDNFSVSLGRHRSFFKARLHRRLLSRQLDAIFVALKSQQVSNMFETPYDIAAANRIKNRTWFTRAILKLQLWRDKNCIELPRQKCSV